MLMDKDTPSSLRLIIFFNHTAMHIFVKILCLLYGKSGLSSLKSGSQETIQSPTRQAFFVQKIYRQSSFKTL